MLKFVSLFAISVAVTSYLLETDFCHSLLNVHLKSPKGGLFTKEELARYNGIDHPELYLAILGQVFNVTSGAKYYGPDETYHIFVGRDNSRSFVSGEFSETAASDDVLALTNQELRSLSNWLQFYKKQYQKIGKLIGRFYNENGKLTPYGKEIKILIKAAEEAHHNADLEKLKFPPCNIEWDAQKGTRVWCTNRSGGIERDWIGVPRQLYEVGATDYRCACIHDGNRHLGTIKEYEGCDPDSDSCIMKMS